MGVIPSAEAFLYTILGVLLLKGLQLLGRWWSSSTEKRRAEVDEVAALRSENRRLKESLHGHRTLMINSGMWTHETLPTFLKE